MIDVFVTRSFDPPIAEGDESEPVNGGGRCFTLHRVRWQESSLSRDGRTMICRFTAPDAESVRLALRQAGVGFDSVRS
jgi:hypothetical protein